MSLRGNINLLKPSGLTLTNSTWCSHCIYVFCTDFRTNSKFALYHTNRLVFITQVDSVYCAVRTESLFKTDFISFLRG
jgi:hypothetical protein